MGVFRSKSGVKEEKITREESERFKMHTANVHDPILTAVLEAQPFEQAADRLPTLLGRQALYAAMLQNGELRDAFGTRIHAPDMLNPTRLRNERPLDTIKAFEYRITGDQLLRDQLETPRLGWGFHENFPLFNATNPYGNQNLNTQSFVQPVYQAPAVAASSAATTKKKRGLFGRKK